MRDILAGAMSLVSWKTLALLLAFVNLKNLPFIWHVGVSFRSGVRWNWCSRASRERFPVSWITQLTEPPVPRAVLLLG